jgi:putative NADH-flavin reductase
LNPPDPGLKPRTRDLDEGSKRANMKVIVFGATGHCGGYFVRMAAERGHRVTAVVRPSTAYDAPEGVEVLRGDVLDADFVAGAIPGHDAVMSGVGMRYAHPWATRQSPDDFTSRALANIVAGMKTAGVSRISFISAAGIGDSRPGLNWVMRLMLATSNVGAAYQDLERAEEILRESGLDWQAVRPTVLTHGARTDRVRITDRFRATASIPREDVAAFVLSELERSSFGSRTPLITVT